MDVATTIDDCRRMRSALGSVALVPTMGALHEGHLSLIRQAREHGEAVAVSIFVNPTQFNERDDFSRYPRPIERDLELCRQEGVDLAFNPSADEMYPPHQPSASIELSALTNSMEGVHRPGHFAGVCQVVAKLFGIVQPDAALFGIKDFQQLRVIEAMTSALNLPVTIVRCETVREPDGLAMSSRNRHLSDGERRRATAISRGLFAARHLHTNGERDVRVLERAVESALNAVSISAEYVSAVDADTLQPIASADTTALLAVAARVGETRLIDNVLLQPPQVW